MELRSSTRCRRLRPQDRLSALQRGMHQEATRRLSQDDGRYPGAYRPSFTERGPFETRRSAGIESGDPPAERSQRWIYIAKKNYTTQGSNDYGEEITHPIFVWPRLRTGPRDHTCNCTD